MYAKLVRFGCLVALLHLAVSLSGTHAATTTDNFNTDPLWAGNNNTGFGTNNYGYRTSNFAGGAAGEVGGAVASRTAGVHTWYADNTLGGTFSLTDAFGASGRMTMNAQPAGFDGGFELGFFNLATPTTLGNGGGVGGIDQAATIRFLDDNGDLAQYRANVRIGTSEGGTATLDVGTDYLFDMQYNPTGGGAGLGKLDVTFRLASDNSLVAANSQTIPTGTPWSLNGFGIATLNFGTNNGPADFFIDNVTYSIVPEPSALVLFGFGIAGLAVCRARRRR
jgi:hypothetical protein